MKTNDLIIKIDRHISEVKNINGNDIYIEKWNNVVEGSNKPFFSNGTLWLDPKHPAGIIKSTEMRQKPSIEGEHIQETLVSHQLIQSDSSALWPPNANNTLLEFRFNTNYGSHKEYSLSMKTNSVGTPVILKEGDSTYNRQIPLSMSLPKRPSQFLRLLETKEGSTKWGEQTVKTVSKKYTSLNNQIQVILTCIDDTNIPAIPMDLGTIHLELPEGCIKTSLQMGSGIGVVQQHRELKPQQQTIEVNGKSYDCWVDTISDENSTLAGINGTTGNTLTRWLHPDVPGRIVKTEKKVENQSGFNSRIQKPIITELLHIKK